MKKTCRCLKPSLRTFLLAAFFLAPRLKAHEVPVVAPTTLTGGCSVITNLNAAGVQPFATLTTEFWGNVDGGLQTGWWYNHLLDFGAEFDTEKLGGWAGGSFLAEFHWVKNRRDDVSFADYTGATFPVSGVIAADHFRVYNLFYRQTWRQNTVTMKLGQLAADDDFMLSDYTGLFANSTLGALPSQVDMPSFPVYPVAAPGLFLQVRPTEPLYLQTGLYYGRPGQDVPSNYGFDWVSESDPALAMFYEGGYKYQLAGHSATTRLGGTYHSGECDVVRAINDGHPNSVSCSPYSFYAIQDTVLASRSGGEPLLALFVRGGIKPEFHESIVAGYGDAGLNWFGPLPGRADDVTGVAFACTAFGKEYWKAGGPNGVAATESTLTFAYKAQITRCFSLSANVQFLFNPAVSPDSGKRETATVLGLRGQLQF